MEVVLFYIMAALILVFSVLTVTSRRILRAAVYLLFVLIAAAGLFFIQQFAFLAAVQLTLYAGGIIVLIIFSVMLTSHVSEKLDAVLFKKASFALVACTAGAVVCISTILSYPFPKPTNGEVDASMKAIGTSLLGYKENGFALPFEVISILLLAAMLGAIIIAKRTEK
ncbi:MAG: NADH-quinone oxidoreductase subunit J [Ignavibacteria bacterium]|nr:NADH-quinone oxidoreductase subunit J [Ignavibacteria bacterium]